MVGPDLQVRFPTDLTDEENVSQRAWNDATAPDCPWCGPGKCELAPHGFYARVKPPGTPLETRFSDIEIGASEILTNDRKLAAPDSLGRAVLKLAILGGYLNCKPSEAPPQTDEMGSRSRREFDSIVDVSGRQGV